MTFVQRQFAAAAQLEHVPVCFAWEERGMRLCCSAIPGQPPMSLDGILRLLPFPTVGEATRIFGQAFERGLRQAVRAIPAVER